MTATTPEPTVTRHTLTLADGRQLDWSACGDSGPVLLHHHILPGSAEPQSTWRRAAAARRLRLVTVARPGYGRSSRNHGRSVADFAADCKQLLDALGVDGAYVSGSSGGGPFALACAALLRERVRAVAVHGSPAPMGMPDLDFTAGMSPDNAEEYIAAQKGEAALTAHWDAVRPALLGASANPERMRARRASMLPAVDAASLTMELVSDVARGMLDGLAASAAGCIDDDLSFTRPWGFDLASLAGVPVSLWHGTEDTTVPIAHGRWLAAHVPGAHAHLLEGEGHISIAQRHIDALLDELTAGGPSSA